MLKDEGYRFMGAAQLFNYMRIARQQIGYLLHFGTKGGLQWKRFILTDLHSPGQQNTNRH